MLLFAHVVPTYCHLKEMRDAVQRMLYQKQFVPSETFLATQDHEIIKVPGELLRTKLPYC